MNKRAVELSWNFIMLMILGLLFAGIIIWAFFPKFTQAGTTFKEAIACNNNQMRCSCLFGASYVANQGCPSEAIRRDNPSENCPLNCDANSFNIRLKEARADKTGKSYGACCIAGLQTWTEYDKNINP